MPSQFVIDYIVWVFVGAVATIQFVAARNGLLGIMFARRFPQVTMVASFSILLISSLVYFLNEPRNQPDDGLGLDANVQARWFVVSAMGAILVTVLISSVFNHRWGLRLKSMTSTLETSLCGIDMLRSTTYARAMVARLQRSARTTRKREND